MGIGCHRRNSERSSTLGLTTLRGQRPCSAAASSCPSRRRVSGIIREVADATCGVTITLSMLQQGVLQRSIGLLTSKTSSAAPAMAPCFQRLASSAASSWHVGPRPLFTKIAVTSSWRRTPARPDQVARLSLFRGACMETKSERSSSSM